MTKILTPPWPDYSDEEIAAVTEVLRSGKVNYWTGHVTKDFEEAFAKWCGTHHAIAVANGTVALDLCLAGLGIGARNGGTAEDEVIVPPRSFIASVSVVVNAGAKPVFVDVNSESQNIEPTQVAKAITSHTRAVICVHLAGWPCDMDAIKNVCKGHNIKLIEDCAQAHGALYKGQPVGGLSDVAAWSFCQDKIMTTGGEGGMVTCNNEKLWKRMWSLKDHGKSYEDVKMVPQQSGYRWLHHNFGTNWRLTEMQSAIGIVQLKRVTKWSEIRQRNAKILLSNLKEFTGKSGILKIPKLQCIGCEGLCTVNGCRHAWYRCYIEVLPERLAQGRSTSDIVMALQKKGVPCNHGTCSELYLEKAFENTQFKPRQPLPVAKYLGERSISFATHPTIGQKTMTKIAQITAEVIRSFKLN